MAIKVVKSKLAYFNQGLVEVNILSTLNAYVQEGFEHPIVELDDQFITAGRHLCLVFKVMSLNLYELIKQNQFRGLSTNLIRVFLVQILDALQLFYDTGVVHCDLKPENILLSASNSHHIRVIDLGSACMHDKTMYCPLRSSVHERGHG